MKLNEIKFKPSVNFVVEVIDVDVNTRQYILRTMQGQIIDTLSSSKELGTFFLSLEFPLAPELKL